MVEIDVVYEGELRCRATHGPSGQTLTTDAPVDNHGKGEAFSPTDLIATALGTCIATVMGIVAERESIDLRGLRIRVRKEMTSTPPRRVARLTTHIEMPVTVTPEQRVKLEGAARFCPVHHSLSDEIDTPIEFVYPATVD